MEGSKRLTLYSSRQDIKWGKGYKKAMVRAEDVQGYSEDEEDANGNAILPCNFLPYIVDNLPDGCCY